MYALVAILIVLGTVFAAYTLTNGFQHTAGSTSSGGDVLVPSGTSYSLPVGQYSGTSFTVSSVSVITGSLNSSTGTQLYLMTPSEFNTFVKTTNVTGFDWTSGWVANQTIYQLDIPVPVGSWVLVFNNPSPYLPTGITAYSNITLRST